MTGNFNLNSSCTENSFTSHIQKLEISYWQSAFFHHRRIKEEKSGKRSRAIQKEVY